MKKGCEETHKFSSFVIVRDDLYRQQINMGLYESELPSQTGGSSCILPQLTLLSTGALLKVLIQITLCLHIVAHFGIWHREVHVKCSEVYKNSLKFIIFILAPAKERSITHHKCAEAGGA